MLWLLQIADGFFVKKTRDSRESAAYLVLMTRYLQSLYSVSIPQPVPSLVASACYVHLSILTAIFQVDLAWVSRCQNVYILDFIGAKDDGGGGDNWSCKTCKVPVKLSSLTKQHLTFYRLDVLPVAQPAVSKQKKIVDCLGFNIQC